LIATTGKVIFIGSNEQDRYPHVIALDEATGSEVWEYGDQNPVALAAANKNIYVGEIGSVTALNSESGNVLWSTPLPFSKSVTKLVVQDGVIYVDAVGADYYLLDIETGAVLQTISYTINNNMNSNLPVWSDHLMDLELSDNAMYFQKQRGFYPNGDNVEITAMDKLKKKIWSASVPAINRISVNSSGVYILTLDGTLVHQGENPSGV
jgi:outer membrane protein assembly factor BamB